MSFSIYKTCFFFFFFPFSLDLFYFQTSWDRAYPEQLSVRSTSDLTLLALVLLKTKESLILVIFTNLKEVMVFMKYGITY
jgi:hypothetical protein